MAEANLTPAQQEAYLNEVSGQDILTSSCVCVIAYSLSNRAVVCADQVSREPEAGREYGNHRSHCTVSLVHLIPPHMACFCIVCEHHGAVL
jgi:hypothetical protein